MLKFSKCALAAAASVIALMPAQADPLNDAIMADMPSLMEIYRDLHANPEVSGEEVRTAAKLAAEAKRLGFTVTEKVGGTGVVAVMENGDGPTIMIRADMDGLPLEEKTGWEFASKVKARTRQDKETFVMHACGHDTHMTGWVGTARQLAARREEWAGTLVMILQPAEETGEGARMMLEDGPYTRFPQPDYALRSPAAAGPPPGSIGYSPVQALPTVGNGAIKGPGWGGPRAARQGQDGRNGKGRPESGKTAHQAGKKRRPRHENGLQCGQLIMLLQPLHNQPRSISVPRPSSRARR